MQQMELRATRALARQFLKLGKAGFEAAIDAAAETDGPRGGAEQIRIKLTRAFESSDAFLEYGVAPCDRVGFGVVTGPEGNPGGSVAGIECNGFLKQGDGLFVVLDVESGPGCVDRDRRPAGF
jgi:hypothetical protein